MYNKTSFINETDYAELAGLCGRSPIMRKIMRAHNRIIPRSLPKTVTRQRRDCDLNPGPTAPESSTLTTRLPSHQAQFGLDDATATHCLLL